ncbi:MAG: CcmD family protein [Saprospiraceae bacterium]
MKSIFRHLIFFFALLGSSNLLAQSPEQDFMRSMGKMYVVVAVIVAIFIGIIVFITLLDKRLTKLENQIKKNGKA